MGHDRPEGGPADTDVDDVANTPSGVPFPVAVAHCLCEIGHLVEDMMDDGNHVLAIDHDGGVSGRSKRDVEHRAAFRDIDFVTPKHGIDPLAQIRFRGQPQEQSQSLLGDSILRIVEIDPSCLRSETLSAFGILVEELS